MALSNAQLRPGTSRFAARRSALVVAIATQLVTAVIATTVTFTPSEASAAEPTKRKVLAVYVEGNSASEARDDILSVLPDRITVADKDDVTSAMRKFGLTKPMGSAITQAKTRSGLVPRLKKAAKEAGSDGFIVGVVQRYSGKWRVYVVWLSPDGDDLLVDEAVSREGSEDDRRSALKSALSNVIEQFSPKPAETNSTTTDKPKTEFTADDKGADAENVGDTSKRVRHEAGSSILNVEVGMEGVGRFFSFSDGISSNLRAYDVFPAPAVFVGLDVYPAGFTKVPVLRDIGLTAGFARAFALQSATADGTPIDTVYQRYYVGLRYRIPISRPTGPVFTVSGQYYRHTFQSDEPPALAGQVPNADYSAIRAGVDARIPLGRPALMFGFDWIEPLSAGPVYDRFREPKVHGVGGKLGLFIKIASGFELRMAAEYQRFFADFDPVLGNAYIAGGALDQYLGFRLSAAYVE